MVISIILFLIGLFQVIVGNCHANEVRKLSEETRKEWEEEFGKIADSNIIINFGFVFIIVGLLGILLVELTKF